MSSYYKNSLGYYDCLLELDYKTLRGFTKAIYTKSGYGKLEKK